MQKIQVRAVILSNEFGFDFVPVKNAVACGPSERVTPCPVSRMFISRVIDLRKFCKSKLSVPCSLAIDFRISNGNFSKTILGLKVIRTFLDFVLMILTLERRIQAYLRSYVN